ncbi:GvpL/GvpF family gas vesicle protein, partial [Streptomyces sp. NPDC006265]|uniref:GvpL/GvpF family gas vesicle protein n=1 Tax=Streptomyces sp. NPDC006265 TaxID=3156740 RepID=UPI0033ACE2F2
ASMPFLDPRTRTYDNRVVELSTGPESTGWLANVSFLVDRESADSFLAAVEQLRKDMPHLEVRVNGPLPPYSFVEPGPAEPAGTVVSGTETGAG